MPLFSHKFAPAAQVCYAAAVVAILRPLPAKIGLLCKSPYGRNPHFTVPLPLPLTSLASAGATGHWRQRPRDCIQPVSHGRRGSADTLLRAAVQDRHQPRFRDGGIGRGFDLFAPWHCREGRLGDSSWRRKAEPGTGTVLCSGARRKPIRPHPAPRGTPVLEALDKVED